MYLLEYAGFLGGGQLLGAPSHGLTNPGSLFSNIALRIGRDDSYAVLVHYAAISRSENGTVGGNQAQNQLVASNTSVSRSK